MRLRIAEYEEPGNPGVKKKSLQKEKSGLILKKEGKTHEYSKKFVILKSVPAHRKSSFRS